VNPFPANLTDRWRDGRGAGEHGSGTLYWHVLLGGDLQLRVAVQAAQSRIAHFPGLHMTPLDWLHLTVLAVGPADQVSDQPRNEMLSIARSSLARIKPVSVEFSRVFYHPEAIGLLAHPAEVDAACDGVLQHERAACRAGCRCTREGHPALLRHGQRSEPGCSARRRMALGLAASRIGQLAGATYGVRRQHRLASGGSVSQVATSRPSRLQNLTWPAAACEFRSRRLPGLNVTVFGSNRHHCLTLHRAGHEAARGGDPHRVPAPVRRTECLAARAAFAWPGVRLRCRFRRWPAGRTGWHPVARRG
jgi:hypothetical protein